MKKTKKTSNSTTHYKGTITKPVEQYYDLFSYRLKPISESFIEHLGKELMEWAETFDDAFTISQFFTMKRIHSDDFYRWIRTFDHFKRAYDTALLFLGNRREIGALKRKLDPIMVKTAMHHYSPLWKKDREENLKVQEKSQGGNITVVMDPITIPEGYK